jgi:hypothetical protein
MLAILAGQAEGHLMRQLARGLALRDKVLLVAQELPARLAAAMHGLVAAGVARGRSAIMPLACCLVALVVTAFLPLFPVLL